MPIERERVTEAGRFPPWVRHEHLARYLFAAEHAVDKIVVDCACGDGTCARTIAPRAGRVSGFDLSEETVREARASTDLPNVDFAVGDAAALPVPDGFADLYISLETIEHVVDQDALLREATRILKSDGMLVCSTPDRDVYSPGSRAADPPWNRHHRREFTQAEFASLLRQYFARVELYGQNPKSPTLVAIRCAIGRHAPGHLVVRANQASKLPRFLYDRLEHHRVLPAVPDRRYEALVAVCTGPVRPRGDGVV
jgi:ubiquinone/menaquinone biosynthesis C-methylase UbiE